MLHCQLSIVTTLPVNHRCRDRLFGFAGNVATEQGQLLLRLDRCGVRSFSTVRIFVFELNLSPTDCGEQQNKGDKQADAARHDGSFGVKVMKNYGPLFARAASYLVCKSG